MSLIPSPEPVAPSARRVSVTLLIVALLIASGSAVAATAIYFELKLAAPTGVTVVDDLGRSVGAPINAARVVVLAPSVLDIVYRLGLRDRVVGVGCDPHLSGGLLNEYTPNQSALWNVSAGLCITDFPALAVEELLNRSPQLILASTITSAAAVEELSATYHIAVVLLSPNTLEGIVNDVRLVGQLFPSVGATTNALVAQLNLQLVAAGKFDSNLSSNGVALPTVLVTYYYDGGGYYTFGPDSFGQSMIDVLGAVNIASSSPLVYFEMNATAVLNASPEIVLYGTSWNDPWIVANQTPAQWQSTTGGAPYWSQLTGAKDAVDITLMTEADPSLILAIPLLLHLVHPTLVPPP